MVFQNLYIYFLVFRNNENEDGVAYPFGRVLKEFHFSKLFMGHLEFDGSVWFF